MTKIANFDIFGHFDAPRTCQKPWLSVKCLETLFGHIKSLPEIGLRTNLILKFRRNGIISIYLEFPLYFSSISYIKYDPFVGGSNDLQMAWNFFPELFMIFLHRNEHSNTILKKCAFLVHPNAQYIAHLSSSVALYIMHELTASHVVLSQFC